MAATPEQAAENAAMRAWAAENGFTVSDRGAMPKGVKAAWLAATQAPPPAAGDGGGPDWAGAAAALGIDPAEAEEVAARGMAAPPAPPPDPGPPTAAPPAEQPGPAGPPPPADLNEARARIGAQQRRPPWAKGGQQRPQGAPQQAQAPAPAGQPVKVTAAVRADIEGKLAMMLAMPVMSWKMADPVCGGAAADQTAEFCRALAPLICQSPDMVEWFSKGTTFMLWLAVAKSLQPVGAAVWNHHIAPGREDGDQGQAQVPAPDQSAYPTVRGHAPAARPQPRPDAPASRSA